MPSATCPAAGMVFATALVPRFTVAASRSRGDGSTAATISQAVAGLAATAAAITVGHGRLTGRGCPPAGCPHRAVGGEAGQGEAEDTPDDQDRERARPQPARGPGPAGTRRPGCRLRAGWPGHGLLAGGLLAGELVSTGSANERSGRRAAELGKP